MRWAVPGLCLVVASCGACAPRHAHQARPPTSSAPWVPAIALKSFAVDPAFDSEELAAIADAATRLEVQTRGRIRIRLEFDPASRATPVRRRAVDEPATTAADEWFKTEIYAWTSHLPDETGVNLIADRLQTRSVRVHVAMHEMLHAIGVHHVAGDARAIMAPSTFADAALAELTTADVYAVCAAIGCAPWLVR